MFTFVQLIVVDFQNKMIDVDGVKVKLQVRRVSHCVTQHTLATDRR